MALPGTGVPVGIPVEIPVDVTAEEARRLAAAELARAAYQADRPSWVERAVAWLGARITDLLGLVGAASPGGIGGLLVLALVVVAVVVVVRRRIGRAGRSARVATPLFDERRRTADEHRRAADALDAEGRHDEAVRERMRGLVRGLEERDLLDVRPGRTAGEAADAASRVVPDAADALRTAARRFDETVYGGRPADAATSGALRDADARVGAARPVGPVA